MVTNTIMLQCGFIFYFVSSLYAFEFGNNVVTDESPKWARHCVEPD